MSDGNYLLAAMQQGPDGSRAAACPACAEVAAIPATAGGWVGIRCGACGTEFHATDGTPPPPPPPPPPPLPSTADIIRRNLRRWVEAGEPDRWVAARGGRWTDRDFAALVDSLAASGYWPLDLAGVRQALTEAAVRYQVARRPVPPPDLPRYPTPAPRPAPGGPSIWGTVGKVFKWYVRLFFLFPTIVLLGLCLLPALLKILWELLKAIGNMLF